MVSDEGFKAASEIAKTTGKAIEVGEKGGRYLTEIFADAINAIAGAASDTAQGFRLRNRASVAIKTEKHLRSLGLDNSYITIDERIAVPLVEALSTESDDGLQDLWASYIANAAAPSNKAIGATKMITNVISQLEPEDKHVLDRLFGLDLDELRDDPIVLTSAHLGASDEALNFSLSRFVALGLFSCDNSGSVGISAGKSTEMPCNLEIHTTVGWFRALPLLLMFKQSIRQTS